MDMNQFYKNLSLTLFSTEKWVDKNESLRKIGFSWGPHARRWQSNQAQSLYIIYFLNTSKVQSFLRPFWKFRSFTAKIALCRRSSNIFQPKRLNWAKLSRCRMCLLRNPMTFVSHTHTSYYFINLLLPSYVIIT